MIFLSLASRPSGTYEVREYVRSDGTCPFVEWLGSLQVRVRVRVHARIARFRIGNLGDRKSLGEGVYEARFHFGSGYRLYFGVEGRTVVVLLCGGDKSSQRNDVQRAKDYWKDYLERRGS